MVPIIVWKKKAGRGFQIESNSSQVGKCAEKLCNMISRFVFKTEVLPGDAIQIKERWSSCIGW